MQSMPNRHDPAGLGRRVTEPMINTTPQISLNLHIDYLSAQSTFLRGLFSGANPLDLINTTNPSKRYTVPTDRLPRLLPSSPNHPVLYLPVPDPSSFQLLIHWIYFGRTDFIQDALNRGIIQWEGIARNVEYLGFPHSIKIFLGTWYGHWVRSKKLGFATPTKRLNNNLSPIRANVDTDTDEDDRLSHMIGDLKVDDDAKPLRGRTTVSRPLSSNRYRG